MTKEMTEAHRLETADTVGKQLSIICPSKQQRVSIWWSEDQHGTDVMRVWPPGVEVHPLFQAGASCSEFSEASDLWGKR